MGFFRFFVERHTLAIVTTLMILLVGAATLFTIQRDIFPHVEFGELMITTRYPGASPEDVELNVTNKIEEELKEVSGIDRYTSYSMENISVMDIMIEPDVSDLDKKVREIREAVQRVTDFPAEVDEAPLVMELDTSILPVVEVGVTGDVPYAELREYAKRLEDELERVDGVARMDRYGYFDREVKIEVDAGAIDRLQVPIRTVIAAIQARNVRSTGGSFESYTSSKNVVTLAEFEEPAEVGDVIVRSSFDGPSVRVKDVAVVRDTFEEPKLLSRVNGQSAISFVVFKKTSGDAIRTMDDIRAAVDKVSADFPEGVSVNFSNDVSRYIRNRMQVVMSNGAIGLAFVLVLLGLFLSVRSAFWVALGIPVAALGTVALLPLFDHYIDVIGLAAMIMIIGIVVDDAIIVAENIHSKREEGLEPVEAATRGIAEVYKPVITTVLTTGVAFAPMFFMTGLLGKFVFIIPLVITLGLGISLLEITVALPSHLIQGMRKREQRGRDPKAPERSWFHHVRDFYRFTIYYVLKARYLVIAVSLGMLFGGLWWMQNKMDFVLFPTSVSEEVFIRVELPRGTSLEATSDKIKEIEAFIEGLPDGEVESYVTRVGNQGDFVMGENENWAVIAIYLTPFATRDRVADEVVEDLRAKTDQLEGYDNLLYYVDAGGPPVGRPITLRVVGTDDEARGALADSVVALMHSMKGVKDIDRNDKAGKDQVEIDIDYEKLARLGLTVADVARTVRIAFDGEVVTSVRYGDEDVEFRVMMNERTRANPGRLDDLMIPNDRNRLIPLSEVAKLRTAPGTASVYHFDGDRAIMITADVDKNVTTPLKATNAIVDNFDLAEWPGMRFVVGGESEETAKSMRSLFVAFITAVVLIYFLLVLLFDSPVQPLMVMSAIPLGIIGVVIAFTLHREPLGFMAMMGLIGLSGVVVNDSLVLVNYINMLRKRRPGDPLLDIVSDGAADRLRAILLTTLTTVAGLLPLAYGIGGSDPFIAPMALAMGFGLLFASPITLALVPSLYLVINDLKRFFRWIGRGFRSRTPELVAVGGDVDPKRKAS